MEWVKIVTTVPLTHAESVRQAADEAGAGHVGNYTFCSFSVRGTGRFKAGNGATPFVGAVGKEEEVEEEQIWWNCPKEKARMVVDAIRTVHPYEEAIIDVYPLLMV